ncbi:MAG: hypothetical protein ACE5LU_11545 [Anaerolineae bacterium]
MRGRKAIRSAQVDRRGFFKAAAGLAARAVSDAVGVLEAPRPIETPAQRVAVLDPRWCSAWDGGDCRLCWIRCPRRDEALILDGGRPVIRPQACDGCGECERTCATVNDRLAVRIADSG